MGKIILENVEFEINIPLDRDARRTFKIEGEGLQDLKDTINRFGEEIAREFEVNLDQITVKGAGFSQNRFVVF